ncbi:phosphoadenosine phosphosulfate reductase domain-containing protein [Thermofilum pendens]|uniref:Phosphoadenosine phosphosulfate reductase n=1 Tax=Thermofilum pendens (strain DSM 2475 / Hrk 5) TaxID=368408 RepID=A1RXY7_THEPD|nr:phosphoadenosine phosphosulfate reductase family protein [Thermofilum pendens]ABL78067.1 phosphoadenosine phosphosulfate reductase [Thermofilum pendens Hrk 5]
MSSFEVLKRSQVHVWWDLKENLPRLTASNSEPCFRVRLSPPGDARPLVGHYYKFVFRVIETYFGGDPPFPRRKIALVNKVPYPDLAEEVVIDGQVAGHLLYDLRSERWRFKPLYAGAEEALRNRKGYYAIVDLPRLSRGYVVKKDSVVEANLPEGDEYVTIGTKSGDFYGVGAMLRNRRIYVLKAWRARPRAWLSRDPDWSTAVLRNREYLLAKEAEAVSFIREVAEKYRLPVFVSLSGGKDSLVTLHLAVKALGNEKVKALFNNTGLEFEETVEYARRIADYYGVELIEADAGDNFWRALPVMGPPARDYRWCCKVTKFSTISRAVKKFFPEGALSLVGQRKYESSARALSPRIWRNYWLPGVVAASPVHDWSAMDIWLYIFMERLPVNKLYYYGFDRLGCWLCPASEMGELDLLRIVKPGLYDKWKSYLESYAQMNGLGEEWVKFGLWRWVRPPKDIQRICVSQVQARRGARYDRHASGNTVEYRLHNPSVRIIEEKVRNLWHTLNKPLEIESVQVTGNAVALRFKREATASELELVDRVLIRSYFCVECLECSNWCPTKSISIDSENGGIKVNESTCIHCGTCNYKCPVVEYTFKHLEMLKPQPQTRTTAS